MVPAHLEVCIKEDKDDEVRAMLIEGDLPLQLDLRNSASYTPIMIASVSNAIKSLTIMLNIAHSKNTIDAVDSVGMTALNHASQRGHLKVVELLLEKGADFEASDENRNTPLMGLRAMGVMRLSNYC